MLATFFDHHVWGICRTCTGKLPAYPAAGCPKRIAMPAVAGGSPCATVISCASVGCQAGEGVHGTVARMSRKTHDARRRRTTTLRFAGIVGAMALSVVALHRAVTVRVSPSDDPPPNASLEGLAPRSDRTPADERPAGPSDVQPPQPTRSSDPLDQEWDELSAAERIQLQRDRLTTALAKVRRGEEVAVNVAKARDALTALRPELYTSSSGRAEHRALERRVDRVANAHPQREGKP